MHERPLTAAAPRELRAGSRWRWAGAVVLGLLVAGLTIAFGFGLRGPVRSLSGPLLTLVFASLWLGPRWARVLAWLWSGGLAAVVALALLTPVQIRVVEWLTVDDAPQPADAIVVLSARNLPDRMSATSTERFLHGLRLYRAGLAPSLVFTGVEEARARSYGELAVKGMEDLEIATTAVVPFEVARYKGVVNTHVEALSLAKMAQARGWQRLIMVTSPEHSRRAKATFERAGLNVLSVPCPSGQEVTRDSMPAERLRGVAPLMHELFGLVSYRLRGWI